MGRTFPFSGSQLKIIQQMPLAVMLRVAASRHEHPMSAGRGREPKPGGKAGWGSGWRGGGEEQAGLE